MSKLYSWSRLAGRTLAAAAGIEGPPTKLTFVVTKRCYSRCTYCDIWKVKDTPGGLDNELTLDEVKAAAAANPFLQWIDFTGGEPTDRPDFIQVVQAFAEACPDLLLVHFPTNGLATRRIHETVVQLRKTVRARLIVSVSVDGPPELNDRLRGVRNDFAHAVDTFAAVRAEIGPANTYIGMTLHGHKGSCGRTTTELVEDTFAAVNAALVQRGQAGIDWGTLHLNIPHFSQHFYGNRPSEADSGFGGSVHRAEIAAALHFAASKSSGMGVPPMSGGLSNPTGETPAPQSASASGGMGVPPMSDDPHISGGFSNPPATAGLAPIAMRAIERVYRAEAQRYLATGRTKIVCSALLSTAYLSEKGNVYPCTIWNKPLGNIRDTGYALMPIIEKARRDGVRRAVATAHCPNCWTPCEAYPSIMASPLRSILTLARKS